MANSKFEYVRQFEREEYLLPNTWIVVRIDGRGFHMLSNRYGFVKPNDLRALNLMNAAAQHTLRILPDIILAYGHSDEYSFVFHKSCTLFERRSAKIASTVVSTFTSAYIHLWPRYFSSPPIEGTFFPQGNQIRHGSISNEIDSNAKFDELGSTAELNLSYLPTFDSRCICYPSDTNLRDYLSWRQADCHINNLYNTTFWALVLRGDMSNVEAEVFLKGSISSDKNEILWSKFGVNYNNELDIFKKGSLVLRNYATLDLPGDGPQAASEASVEKPEAALSKTQHEKLKKARQKAEIIIQHLDIIKDEFWHRRPWLLSGKPGKPVS